VIALKLWPRSTGGEDVMDYGVKCLEYGIRGIINDALNVELAFKKSQANSQAKNRL